MKKTIISTVALLLILQGCGSSDSNNKKEGATDAPISKVSNEVKSFAIAMSDSDDPSSTVKGSSSSSSEENTETKNKIYHKSETESCEDGGTQTFSSNINEDTDMEELGQILETTKAKTDMLFDNCIEDGEKINGAVSFTIQGSDWDVVTILYPKTTTFEDLETTEITTIFKNSTMKIESVSDDIEKITQSIKASSSTGKKYESINLISIETEEENNSSSYDISGQLIHEGITYTVDEKYDMSKTPMVFENDENLISGLAKYYNEKNQSIAIEVVGKNQIKISVDRDNDGDIDEEETINI